MGMCSNVTDSGSKKKMTSNMLKAPAKDTSNDDP